MYGEGLWQPGFLFPWYYVYLVIALIFFTIVDTFQNNTLVATYHMVLIVALILLVDFAYHIMHYFKIVIYNPSADEVVTGKFSLSYLRFFICGHSKGTFCYPYPKTSTCS